jgi:hypothetical protein
MRLFAVLLLLASELTNAETFSVKSLAFKGEMPYVESSDSEVAAKMNASIYLDMLEMPAPENYGVGIQNVPEDISNRQSDISFKVWRNDAKILSIETNAEGCGAYCETYSRYFNFDATTGDKIEPGELFTESGLATLNKQLMRQRKVRIDKEISNIKQEAKKNCQKSLLTMKVITLKTP